MLLSGLYDEYMLAAVLTILTLQNNWSATIPAKDWPLFQGHRPVAPPRSGPVRYWYYSFPAKFEDVVTLARHDLSKKRYHEEAHGKANSANVLLRRGLVVSFTITVMDDSYSITRDKRISMLNPKKDPWDRMESTKGWVTVVRALTAGGGGHGRSDFSASDLRRSEP
jgi:hypothetical protein